MGYYVNNEYMDEALAEDPPTKPVIEKVRRNILAEKPRVTRFAIKWDSEESAPAEFPPEQPDVDAQEDDGATYGADEEVEDGVEVEGEAEPQAEAEAAVKTEDAEMEGVETNGKEEDEGSDDGSEDIEAESEEDDEEELEDEEGEGESMEMDDGTKKETNGAAHHVPEHQQQDVMVH